MHSNRTELRKLQLQEGVLPLRRDYWECRRCALRLHPLDFELELPATGEIAPRFGSLLCRLGVELPFRAAAEVLEEISGRELDPGTLRNELVRTGEGLWGLEQAEAEIHSATLRPGERKRRLDELPPLRSVPHPGEMLFMELDGVMTNVAADEAIQAEIHDWETRKSEAEEAEEVFLESRPSVYRETLNARFYRGEDIVRQESKSGKVRSYIERSETVSVVHDPECFRKRAYAVSECWRASQYRLRVVLGDGAIFERGLHDELNASHEVLDIQHAKGHIYECGRILFGEGTPEAKSWGGRWAASLEESGPKALLAHLREMLAAYQASGEEPPRKLVNLEGYVNRHQRRMRYSYFRSLGLPIATGAIESANRQVVGDRCKRSGMGWKRSSLQALLCLRAALKSGNWEEACAAVRTVRIKRRPRPALPPPEPLIQPDEPYPEEALDLAGLELRLPASLRRHRPLSHPRRGPPAWKTGRRISTGLLARDGDQLRLGERLVG